MKKLCEHCMYELVNLKRFGENEETESVQESCMLEYRSNLRDQAEISESKLRLRKLERIRFHESYKLSSEKTK